MAWVRRGAHVFGLLVGLLLAWLLGLQGQAGAGSWVDEHCNQNTQAVQPITRGEARDYAYVAYREGYEFGGGCWNNNDRDDTPNQPDSNGEGPDCSGLVFKSWYEKADVNNDGFQWHDKLRNIHGPYTASDFKSGAGAPNYNINKKDARRMDAFASTSHIGMIYNVGTRNSDEIIHAAGDAAGVIISTETWRGNSAYSGVARVGWAAP
jgi:hypothetical protein